MCSALKYLGVEDHLTVRLSSICHQAECDRVAEAYQLAQTELVALKAAASDIKEEMEKEKEAETGEDKSLEERLKV